jgi:CRISPR-associated endonuclease/helicase Cas3
MLETATHQEKRQSIQPLLEVAFPVMPESKISSLHGYSLYSALKKRLPWIGECPLTSISSITGIRDGKGLIETHEFSRLLIRTPLSKASLFYGLAGQTLTVGQGQISLRVPTIAPLLPKQSLQARIVIIHLNDGRDSVPPDRFLAVATRKLAECGIDGRISLLLKNGALDRKVLLVNGEKIPGYGVQVAGLSESDSLKLQEMGLGGKRKMGAGFFL